MIGPGKIRFSAEECDIYRATSRVNHRVFMNFIMFYMPKEWGLATPKKIKINSKPSLFYFLSIPKSSHFKISPSATTVVQVSIIS